MEDSTISEWLLARCQGRYLDVPRGCTLYRNAEAEAGVLLLYHNYSNIKILADAIQPTNETMDLVVVYRYTARKAFHSICNTRELWATLLATCGNPKDTCFGDGVYVTILGPDAFGSQERVLINNFSNAPDYETQLRHIQRHLEFAEFCVSLVVPKQMLTNVMAAATPQMKYGPGFTRLGDAVHPNRDIWVLRAMGKDDSVINPAETVDDILQRLRAPHSHAVRRVAALRLGEVRVHDADRVLSLLEEHLMAEADKSDAEAIKVRLAMLQAVSRIGRPSSKYAIKTVENVVEEDCDQGVRKRAAQLLRDWRRATTVEHDNATTQLEDATSAKSRRFGFLLVLCVVVALFVFTVGSLACDVWSHVSRMRVQSVVESHGKDIMHHDFESFLTDGLIANRLLSAESSLIVPAWEGKHSYRHESRTYDGQTSASAVLKLVRRQSPLIFKVNSWQQLATDGNLIQPHVPWNAAGLSGDFFWSHAQRGSVGFRSMGY